ncbi:MAG: M20/M25/M40 family metallo-hydrolase [Dissulfuribacterales bacterium]
MVNRQRLAETFERLASIDSVSCHEFLISEEIKRVLAPFALKTECIIIQAPAMNRFELLVHGRDVHAGADPEKGINAILLASQAISGLKLGRIDPETTCNIGVIDARGATNIVPNLARVKGEVRSHDEKKLADVTRNIVSAFKDVVDAYKRLHGEETLPRLDIHIKNEFNRTFIPKDHPVVTLARQAAVNLGRNITAKKTGGGSDANIFFDKGIITGVIGTGMTDIHSVRESIRLEDMVKTVNLLLEIINIHSNGACQP